MHELVDQALRNTKKEHRKTAPNDADDSEFADPTVTLIGYGADAMSWLPERVVEAVPRGSSEQAELEFTTAGITSSGAVARSESPDTILTYSDDHLDSPKEGQAHAASESLDQVANQVETDAVVIIAHHTATAWLQRLTDFCLEVSTETAVLAMPTIPTRGLSPTEITAFQRLVEAAGTILPVNCARLSEPVSGSSNGGTPTVETVGNIVGRLVCEVIELLRPPSPLPLPVLTTHPLSFFDTGGVAMSCYGSGLRSATPETVLETTLTQRLCDCDPTTATGCIGLLRVGPGFSLKECEAIGAQLRTAIAPSSGDLEGGELAGRVMSELTDRWQLTLFLVGIAEDSIRFLDPSDSHLDTT